MPIVDLGALGIFTENQVNYEYYNCDCFRDRRKRVPDFGFRLLAAPECEAAAVGV
jgi:hypothetical protein